MYRYLLAGALLAGGMPLAAGCQTGARMSYFGGQQVIRQPRVQVLNFGGSQADIPALRTILGPRYLGTMGEYGIGEGELLGVLDMPGPVPKDDPDLRSRLGYGLPAADVYLLTFPARGFPTDQGMALCEQDCGYHSFDPVTGTAYAVVADPGQENCACRATDLTLQGDWDMGASHELAEAATDPDGLGWQFRAGAEVADGCAWQVREVDGHPLTQVWSAKDGRCE